MPRYELVQGASSKFWEIERRGTSFTTTYGRIGGAGQSTRKDWSSEGQAKKEYAKLIEEKMKKGYELVKRASAPRKGPAKATAKSKPLKAIKGSERRALSGTTSQGAKVTESLLARLEKAMAQHYPKRLDSLVRGATEKQLAAFEKEFRLTLPPTVRALYRWRNGSKESRFLRGHTWRSLSDLGKLLASYRKASSALGYSVDPEGDNPWFHPHWLPVFEAHADGLFVTAWAPKGKQPGQIIDFSHEAGGSEVWPSFEEFLAAFVMLVATSRWGSDEGDEAMMSRRLWRKAARSWGSI